MKMKLISLFLLAALAGVLTGCVSTVDGRTQAGVPLLKDKVVGRYERTVPQVVDAARKVLVANGTLTVDNSVNNSLEARVNQSTVIVKVDAEDESKPITRVTVQVRAKGGVTDLDLAHELEKEIALKLAQL
jgi:hypothetical protein